MSKKNWRVKEPGRCIFCDGVGMTKEHIWSDWLNTIFSHLDSHTQIRFRSERHTGDGKAKVAVVVPFIDTHQGAMTQRKVRNVCGKCNGGWMSGAVNRAKPWAELLICDKPARLTL